MQWVFALAMLACSPLSFALSLGEARIESNLNEPLQGSITVNSASASELGSLRVGLAGQQDWQRAGLSPSSAVSRIKFGFKSTGGGRLAITMRTEEPVSEPLLVILVDASWSSGHLLREYTVFLDPANLPKQNTAPVAPPRIDNSANSPRREQAATPRKANPFLVSNAVSSGRYGPVRRGESLSTISEGIFIGTDLTMHQVVWALYAANPHAFVNGNINLLETGVNLKVPSQEEMLALPTSQARELVFQAARLQRPPPGVFAESDSAAKSATTAQADVKPTQNQASQAEPSSSVANEPKQDKAAAEQSTPADNASRAEQPAQPIANDKLELLPLEAVDDAISNPSNTADAQADRQQNQYSDAGGNSAGPASGASEDGQASTRERQLANENAMLRQRIDETEALLKEIRTLLAARSEQLSDLQQRLDRVEKSNTNQQQTNQSEQNSADIGWFWWLLLIVALIIAGLLVALLFILARRSDRGAAPSALMHDDNDDETESDEMFGGMAASPSPAPAVAKEKNKVDDEVEAFIESNLIMPKTHNPEPKGNDLGSTSVAPVIAEEDPQDEPLAEAPVATEAAPEVEPEVEVIADEDSGVERRLPADDTALDFNLDDYADSPAETVEEPAELPEATISEDLEPAEFDVEIPEPISESVPDLNPDLDGEPTNTEPTQESDIPPILNDAELESLEIESQLAEPGAGLDEIKVLEAEPEPEVPQDTVTEAQPEADVVGASTDVSEFSGGDQVATKLDLARVYVDMGDADEARSILNEILEQGSDAQKQEAQSLLDSMA